MNAGGQKRISKKGKRKAIYRREKKERIYIGFGIKGHKKKRKGRRGRVGSNIKNSEGHGNMMKA